MGTILIPRALLGARLHGYRRSRSPPLRDLEETKFFLLRLTPSWFAACRLIRAWVMSGVTLQNKSKRMLTLVPAKRC